MKQKPKTRRIQRSKGHPNDQLWDTLRSLEAMGLIYSALDAKGELRWYATKFAPKGRPKLSPSSSKLN